MRPIIDLTGAHGRIERQHTDGADPRLPPVRHAGLPDQRMGTRGDGPAGEQRHAAALDPNRLAAEVDARGAIVAVWHDAGPVILDCVDCGISTTATEAHSRVYNTNRCGLCGGDLDWA